MINLDSTPNSYLDFVQIIRFLEDKKHQEAFIQSVRKNIQITIKNQI